MKSDRSNTCQKIPFFWHWSVDKLLIIIWIIFDTSGIDHNSFDCRHKNKYCSFLLENLACFTWNLCISPSGRQKQNNLYKSELVNITYDYDSKGIVLLYINSKILQLLANANNCLQHLSGYNEQIACMKNRYKYLNFQSKLILMTF